MQLINKLYWLLKYMKSESLRGLKIVKFTGTVAGRQAQTLSSLVYIIVLHSVHPVCVIYTLWMMFWWEKHRQRAERERTRMQQI